ncbi:MAG: chorismate lyase, partial [Gammaproteobacteria bacterium]|nr:chorismate lyase [Gammaproteobacteria bacterium]
LWVDASRLSLLAPAPTLRTRLTRSGSLTKTIIHHCDGGFDVSVIDQRYLSIYLSERRLLQLPDGASANVRAVLLRCNHQPWVFARTVIPHYALRRSLRHLTQLGNRSLGAVLHASRVMERSQVEYACLSQPHTLFRQATQGMKQPPKQLWGRRILYRIEGDPLLVNEIFLPRFTTDRSLR